MHSHFLYVFILARCLSSAIGSPFDSLFDPIPSLDVTETSLDNPDFLTASIGEGPDDLIFDQPEGIEIISDSPIPLFPDAGFDVGWGGWGGALEGTDFLAETNECFPKERACCLRSGFQQCYYDPSPQCSGKTIICCDRIDMVSLVGYGCQGVSQTTQQPPVTEPQNTDEVPLDSTDEEWLNLIFGID